MNDDTLSPLPRPYDLAKLGAGLEGKWASLALERVAMEKMQLRAMQDKIAPWHLHEESAEVFMVLEGGFWIDFEAGPVRVDAGQLLIVPPRVRHRARAEQRVLLLVMDRIA